MKTNIEKEWFLDPTGPLYCINTKEPRDTSTHIAMVNCGAKGAQEIAVRIVLCKEACKNIKNKALYEGVIDDMIEIMERLSNGEEVDITEVDLIMNRVKGHKIVLKN